MSKMLVAVHPNHKIITNHNRHVRTSHKIEPNIYRRELLSCVECDFVAGSKFILKHHYKTNHKMERFRDAIQCCREIHFDSGYTK